MSSVMEASLAKRLNAAHFAYLRALVKGLDPAASARRYLGMEHGHELQRLHRDLVQHVCALARRLLNAEWPGPLPGHPSTDPPPAEPPKAVVPSIDEWAKEQGLEDWFRDELLEMYQRAFPATPSAAQRADRRVQVQDQQLHLLAQLEPLTAVAAQPHDPLSAWLDPRQVERLSRAGWLTLDDLASAIRRGGRWWRSLPGVGPMKAADLRGLVGALMGPQALTRPLPRPAPVALGPTGPAGLPDIPGGAANAAWALSLGDVATAALDGSAGTNRATGRPLIDASTDGQAIRTWVESRAGSPHTAAAYMRDATRWQMWCVLERGKALSSATPVDCLAYMQFLQRIPEGWISRERVARLAQGWTPFRGPLSLSSRRHAVRIVNMLCNWLTRQRYLDTNPWSAVNLRQVDGSDLPAAPTGRALSIEAYRVLLNYLDQDTSVARERNRFVLVFLRHTGLRASELLAARLADFQFDDGWRLHVVGKGRKPRMVTMTSAAMAAVIAYLSPRLVDVTPFRQPGHAPALAGWAQLPLLGRLSDEQAGITYPSLHKSFKAFVRRALLCASLAPSDLARCRQATAHWLRHTFATRYAEGGGELSVLQAELGQADPQTTSRYYRAIAQHRRREMERIAGMSD